MYDLRATEQDGGGIGGQPVRVGGSIRAALGRAIVERRLALHFEVFRAPR